MRIDIWKVVHKRKTTYDRKYRYFNQITMKQTPIEKAIAELEKLQQQNPKALDKCTLLYIKTRVFKS